MIILRQKEYTSVGKKIGAKIGRLRANTADKKWYIKRSTSEARDKMRNSSLDTGTGFRESGKRILDSAAIIKDERDANRNALKFLKDSGATKEELKTAKENYELGLKSYKDAGLAYILSPIQNKIQTNTK